MAFLSDDRRSESGLRLPRGDAAEIYLRLRSRRGEREDQCGDAFTGHVLACALSVCLSELDGRDRDFGRMLGLSRGELGGLIAGWAPEAAALVDVANQSDEVELDDEEDQIRQLLERYRGDESIETGWLASILTKRSMRPRHLWQDLGLVDRKELGRLMAERFPLLAERNVNHMKWKKFFYRSLCELEGFVLCASPSCRECSDFHDCFGDESGESALARLADASSRDR
jgi:nitrogen fixation protein NifQ